jgi:3-hydroxyacyl-CoA dehydrogenase/enoyl-CoA hydratase/3-hydroxybutyryl-CoA epimerase
MKMTNDEGRMSSVLERPEPRSVQSTSADADRKPNIRRDITDDLICVLTFDRPSSSANIFDEATLRELNEHLDFIESSEGLKGVVLASAKNSIFIAGADLHALASMAEQSSANLRGFIELGQNVFDRIAALPIHTVAAIHGACVGGGYEICLACDYRIASPDRATKIGLPEIQLGILPAWGGSTRLPRLIGLPKALDVILAGKTLAAKPALKCGMVDDLVPRELLVPKAIQRILNEDLSSRRPSKNKLTLTNNVVAARAIAAYVRSTLWKKTRGHYPAPFKALEVVTKGVSRSIAESLASEADAIVELAQDEVSHNLVRIFLLQERAKKVGPTTAKKHASIQRSAVIGAGVMGAGIAQWLSSRGISVILRDINPEAIAKGMAGIAKLYDQGVKRHTFTKVEARAGLDKISPSAAEVFLKKADIVIEAAVEKMDLKKAVFRRLDELSGPDTILATNTSALSVSELALATQHPERVVGIHFFNPVHKMQLVEVVVGKQTSPEVVQRSIKFVQQIGKLPVVVKDSPGFLVNRILMPYLIEAVRLFENGAQVSDLDEAMLDFGMPMGPLRLIDEVGVDVSQHVANTLAEAFSDRLHLPQVLEKMMQAKLLGKKSEAGFYTYNSKKSDVNSAVNLFQSGHSAAMLSSESLQRRMVFLMINEAARCLEEQLVTMPDDVDFGMIMGTGFAPFRGGPLRYADATGVAKIVNEMKRLVESGEHHFEPCALLQSMASEGRKFYGL